MTGAAGGFGYNGRVGRRLASVCFAVGSLALLTAAKAHPADGVLASVLAGSDGGLDASPIDDSGPDGPGCLPSCCIVNCASCGSSSTCANCASQCGATFCGCDCTPFTCILDSGPPPDSGPPVDSGSIDSSLPPDSGNSCSSCCQTNSVCASCPTDANCPACLQGCCSFMGCDCTGYYVCPVADAGGTDSSAPDSSLPDVSAPPDTGTDTGTVDCGSCCTNLCGASCTGSPACAECAAQCNSGGTCMGCDCSRYVCGAMDGGGPEAGHPTDSGGGPPPAEAGTPPGSDAGGGGGQASSGGCGCRTAPVPGGGAGWLVGLLIALATRRRRAR